MSSIRNLGPEAQQHAAPECLPRIRGSGGPWTVIFLPEGVRVLAARQKDAIRRQGTCDAQYRNRLPMILRRRHVGRGTSRSALPSSLVAESSRSSYGGERKRHNLMLISISPIEMLATSMLHDLQHRKGRGGHAAGSDS